MPAQNLATVPAKDKSIEELAAQARKSIVLITHSGRDGRQDGVGSGFVVSRDGLIATCLHVIGEARPMSVQLADGRRPEVLEVHAWDRRLDLALIRVAATNLTPLRLGDSEALQQGQEVAAIGHPLGLEHSVVRGVISARRVVDGVEMIQLAMPIEPGNSGGPLLDARGRVQGLLTLKSVLTPNLGFAMPARELQRLLDRPNPVPLSRWLTIGALNPREWKPVSGARWTQRAGRILVDGPGEGFGGRALCLRQRPPPARPCELAVEVKLDDESGAAGLIFGADGGDRHYGFYPTGGQLRLTRFDGPDVFSWKILETVSNPRYRPGEWNHLRVHWGADRIRCFVNGHLVIESTDDGLREGGAGLAKFRHTRAEFRNFEMAPKAEAAAGNAEPVRAPRLPWSDAAWSGRSDRELLEALGADANAEAGRAALLEQARVMEQSAGRLRDLAQSLHRRAVQAELVQTLEAPDAQADLGRAALLVARLDNPDLDPAPYLRQLDDMAREVRDRFEAAAPDATRLAALRKYLFEEGGFHGSRTDYYHRANSYLNEVLDDREGLPITLAILFLELARRIGLENVSGLPLPGHFMVRYAPAIGPPQIIDVFDGGRSLSRSEAQERVLAATGEGFLDDDLRPATKREIIARMLRNLQSVAEREGATEDVLHCLDALLALEPTSARERLLRAHLRLRTGDRAGAKDDLQRLISQAPAGLDLERLAEMLRSL